MDGMECMEPVGMILLFTMHIIYMGWHIVYAVCCTSYSFVLILLSFYVYFPRKNNFLFFIYFFSFMDSGTLKHFVS